MNKTIPRWMSTVLLASVLFGALWILGRATPKSETGVWQGKAPPSFTGQTASGDTFNLADTRGKVVLINFWATWCGPCQQEMPDLAALQKKYGPQGLTIVGLSIDDDLATVQQFDKRAKLPYPVLLAPIETRKFFGGIPAIPATFLLGRDGKVALAYEGLATQANLAPEIEKLLNGG